VSRHLATLVAVCVLFAPAAALACPVCGTATSEATRNAFVGSTIFLSLLPLTLIGAFVGWGIWLVRKQEREREAAAREARGEAPSRPSIGGSVPPPPRPRFAR